MMIYWAMMMTISRTFMMTMTMLVAQAEESDAFRAGLFTTGGAGTFFLRG